MVKEEKEYTSRYCEGCKEETKHRKLGYIPAFIVQGEGERGHIRATLCLECGGVLPDNVTEEEIDKEADRIVEIMIEEGVAESEEFR